MDLAEELRGIGVFTDLPADQLNWLASLMEQRSYAPGEIVVRAGDSAEYMIVVLEGELRAQSDDAADVRLIIARQGIVSGMLPYSRLTTFPYTSRATMPTRLAALHKKHFPEMLDRIPVLAERLVWIMNDRVREVTKMDVQREKMMALGKLSAGLAHELNNPAAAARRAAGSLRQTIQELREAHIKLDELDLTQDQRGLLACVEREIAARPDSGVLDALERSDREEAVECWLRKHGVQRTWELAADLVDSGFDSGCLDEVASQIPDEILEPALLRLMAAVRVERIASEIEHSTARITELVQSIKEYTYMDQMPEQDVDIHQGLESTLIMLRHELKNGIAIKRSYAPNLPTVCGHGSELNQVWTNIIDNAVDAMKGKGELRIRTAKELDRVLVEIGDTGPGIPKQIKNRIFEPFFTTKPAGQGTGLGLDIVYRIVRAHRGEVTVESVPGDTRFQVRLPAPIPA